MRPLALVLILVVASAAHAQVKWAKDLDAGLRTAKRSRKVAMVVWTREKCPACAALLQGALTDKAVVAATKRWVPVKVDIAKETAKSRRYRVEATPTVLFLDRNGKELGRIVGTRTAEQFLREAWKILG